MRYDLGGGVESPDHLGHFQMKHPWHSYGCRDKMPCKILLDRSGVFLFEGVASSFKSDSDLFCVGSMKRHRQSATINTLQVLDIPGPRAVHQWPASLVAEKSSIRVRDILNRYPRIFFSFHIASCCFYLIFHEISLLNNHQQPFDVFLIWAYSSPLKKLITSLTSYNHLWPPSVSLTTFPLKSQKIRRHFSTARQRRRGGAGQCPGHRLRGEVAERHPGRERHRRRRTMEGLGWMCGECLYLYKKWSWYMIHVYKYIYI